jgi:hypothetical protein
VTDLLAAVAGRQPDGAQTASVLVGDEVQAAARDGANQSSSLVEDGPAGAAGEHIEVRTEGDFTDGEHVAAAGELERDPVRRSERYDGGTGDGRRSQGHRGSTGGAVELHDGEVLLQGAVGRAVDAGHDPPAGEDIVLGELRPEDEAEDEPPRRTGGLLDAVRGGQEEIVVDEDGGAQRRGGLVEVGLVGTEGKGDAERGGAERDGAGGAEIEGARVDDDGDGAGEGGGGLGAVIRPVDHRPSVGGRARQEQDGERETHSGR